MIRVEVKLFATLRRQFPDLRVGEAMSVTLPEEATVARLVNKLALPEEQVKVVFVNGTIRKDDYGLTDGDEVGIFPSVGGGCCPHA
jgi:molybdopterin converting factor small subunit